jgi:hypothetical protein
MSGETLVFTVYKTTTDEIKWKLFNSINRSSFTQTARGIQSTIESLQGYSTIEYTDKAISNMVSNSSTGGSCSWSLTSDGFYVNAGDVSADSKNSVLKVDKNGLIVKG